MLGFHQELANQLVLLGRLGWLHQRKLFRFSIFKAPRWTTASGVPYASSRGPLSRASRPFMGPTSEGHFGSEAVQLIEL
jgi:hypothetical protein